MDAQPECAAPIRAILEAQQTFYRLALNERMPEWLHLDLSMGQLKTLMVLDAQSETNVTALAETLGLGKPATSLLVDKLVQMGFVRRAEDPDDRRRALVALSVAGNALVTRLREGKVERQIRWLEQLAPADLAALRQGIQALAAVAARDTEVISVANAAL